MRKQLFVQFRKTLLTQDHLSIRKISKFKAMDKNKWHRPIAMLWQLSVFLFLSLLANGGLAYMYYNRYVNMHCEPTNNCLNSDIQPVISMNITNHRQSSYCSGLKEKWFKSKGKFYVFSTDEMDWNSSRERCQALGGDLVIINSEEEQEFVSQHVGDVSDYHWIGLTDSQAEGVWLWVDKTPLNHNLSWESPPDDWKKENPMGEDCIILKAKKWADVSCLRRQKRICECLLLTTATQLLTN